MSYVTIVNGTYRGDAISNMVFRMVKDYQVGKKGGFVTVVSEDGEYDGKPIRVKVDSQNMVQPATANGDMMSSLANDASNYEPAVAKTPETDAEIIERLRERFEILDAMTQGTVDGNVRAMIVSGPPGVGKSFGVEAVLERSGMFDTIAQRKPKYEIIKGSMSALGLYAKLFEYSEPGCVLVFDDCDSVLFDEVALNILKAALDTSAKRFISWNSDSRLLRSEGIPDRFEFKGAAIFITNVNFDNVRSKKIKDHLTALESRCHYLDLTMHTTHEKMLRIRQIVRDGMLDNYEFAPSVGDEIVDFMFENLARLRELSLRTVLKIADLRKTMPERWQRVAQISVMK
jgi:hypothetical protein